ncbi:hypothetical protein [Cutibacterium sp. V947]|uniref:hypothetical protein n=1 Tax=unclassified Cutibacterium TaxID=2649671 RepID=UPI003EDF6632
MKLNKAEDVNTAEVADTLGATYLGAFGASHGLAKKIGAWPVTAATRTPCNILCDATK